MALERLRQMLEVSLPRKSVAGCLGARTEQEVRVRVQKKEEKRGDIERRVRDQRKTLHLQGSERQKVIRKATPGKERQVEVKKRGETRVSAEL